MAGNSPYTYVVRMAPTALTVLKTLIQLKAGAARTDLAAAYVYQTTKTASELLLIQIVRKTAAATVTSATPLKGNPNDPASLAAGGISATGVNATLEGTDGDVLHEESWNVLNGTWQLPDLPELRSVEQQAGIIGLKLATNPAASMTIGAMLKFLEWR